MSARRVFVGLRSNAEWQALEALAAILSMAVPGGVRLVRTGPEAAELSIDPAGWSVDDALRAFQTLAHVRALEAAATVGQSPALDSLRTTLRSVALEAKQAHDAATGVVSRARRLH